MKARSYICIISLFLISLLAKEVSFAQEEQGPDTTGMAEPVQREFIKPIPLVGSIDRSLGQERVITDSAMNFKNYKYAGDLIALFPGFYIKEFSALGPLPSLSSNGIAPSGIAFLVDGIPLNEPVTGTFNPYLFPIESIERIEVVNGAGSFIYGLNSTGAAVNFVTKSKKAIKPHSGLRYSESGYGFGIIDGMVSQDITRGLNATLGFQHTVFGERFPNETYDCWNGRMKLRYNMSNTLNIFVSEIFNHTSLGLYGGIDLVQTPESLRYDPLQAIVKNQDAYEKITRHDLQAGIAAMPFRDSTYVSTLTLFYTSNYREYRDEENRPDPNGIFLQENSRSSWMGIRLNQNISYRNQRIDLGALVMKERVLLTPEVDARHEVYTAASAKSDLEITQLIKLSPYIKYEIYRKRHLFSYGGEMFTFPAQDLKIFAGFSRSYRLPTFLEIYGKEAVLLPLSDAGKPESHYQFEAGAGYSGDKISAGFRPFYRVIRDYINTYSLSGPSSQAPYGFARLDKRTIKGLSAWFTIRLGSFYLEHTSNFAETSEKAGSESSVPSWYGTGGFYFWDKLFSGHLDLKLGVNARSFTSYSSSEFNWRADFYEPSTDLYDIAPATVIDLVLIARIGTAYLHFIMDNLLDRKYVTASFYPMPARRLRFGVTWEFLD